MQIPRTNAPGFGIISANDSRIVAFCTSVGTSKTWKVSEKNMNEQLNSLTYYIKWLKHCGVNRSDVEERVGDMEGYIGQFLDENPIGRRWRDENWTADSAPLPVAECNVEANLEEAVNTVYDVHFNEYVRRECQTT